MQPETVYNPTTISGRGERAGYLDSISSQASHGRRRCCTTTIGGCLQLSPDDSGDDDDCDSDGNSEK